MPIGSSYKPQTVSFRNFLLSPEVSPLRYGIKFEGEFAERVNHWFLGIIPVKQMTGTLSFILEEIVWQLINTTGQGLAFLAAMDPSEFKAGGAGRTRSLLENHGLKFCMDTWDIWAACMIEMHSKPDLDVAISIWNADTQFYLAQFDIYVSESLSLDRIGKEAYVLLRAGGRKASHALGARSKYLISYPPAANGTELIVMASKDRQIAEATHIVRSVLHSNGVPLIASKRK